MSIENYGFAAAAVLSLFTWAIHTFVGGPVVAGPLLTSEMKPVPKLTNYYCWHLVTLVLLAMSGGYAYAAIRPGGRDVAVLLSIMAASFCIWSVLLFTWKKRKALELPQWILFLSITCAALWGLAV
jgi:hypothetical protein